MRASLKRSSHRAAPIRIELRWKQSADEKRRSGLGRNSLRAMARFMTMALMARILVSHLPYVLRRIGEMSKEYGLETWAMSSWGGTMHP